MSTHIIYHYPLTKGILPIILNFPHQYKISGSLMRKETRFEGQGVGGGGVKGNVK